MDRFVRCSTRATALLVLVSLAALGCGGQKELPSGAAAGAGAGPAPGADAGPDAEVPVGAEHFPLRDGLRYRYLHSNGGWTETVEVHAVAGEPNRFEQRQSGNPDGSSSVHLFERSGGRVVRTTAEELLGGELVLTVTYDPGFVRFDQAWTDVAPGYVEQNEYDRIATNAGEAAMPAEARTQEFTVESVSDEVTVPAGTFRNCVRVRRVRTDQVGAGAGGEDDGKLYWFAPGVGKVREENVVNGRTEVLTSFEAPAE